jgi:hypothetical protein
VHAARSSPLAPLVLAVDWLVGWVLMVRLASAFANILMPVAGLDFYVGYVSRRHGGFAHGAQQVPPRGYQGVQWVSFFILSENEGAQRSLVLRLESPAS